MNLIDFLELRIFNLREYYELRNRLNDKQQINQEIKKTLCEMQSLLAVMKERLKENEDDCFRGF